MLEERKTVFEKGKIVVFRLVTGDEIIGRVESFDREFVVIFQPCTLMMQQEGIGLAPATMLGNYEIPISYTRSSIVAHMTPNKQFLDIYEQHISEIQLLKKENIIISK